MLTDAQRAEGWREHDGGKCPVPLDSKPDVMFRDGEICKAVPADIYAWDHSYGKDDIIAYREEPRA